MEQARKVHAGEWEDAAAMLAALDALRCAITIFDAGGYLLYANVHFNYLFRSFPPHHSLIGKSYEELIRLEIASGEIAPSELAGGTQTFIASRLAQMGEHAFLPRDICLADRRVVQIKARRDRSGHTVLLWTDVTAAHAQLARLQEAVAMSAEAFAFFDAHDRLILANDLYANLCGVKVLGELMGKTFSQIAAHVAYKGRVVLDEPPDSWLARRLKSHAAPAAATTLKTNTGEAYLVRDRATPDGGRAMVFTDITDKVRAETALAEQQGALANATAEAARQTSYLAGLATRLDEANAKVDSAKTTLLRTMGHELKTPLNAILGFSELMGALAEKMSPEQIREYAGLVHQGGTNLLKMINQIMDLTKIAAGRYELRRTAVDAGTVLWLAREAFQNRADQRGIAINVDHCPAGLMADADETVFAAMIHSLLDNAVTFTTGRTVALSVAQTLAGVAVTVADDGQGVAADDLARIQQPFEHAGRSSEHAKGAGLGLTLVKALAELHGGRLELESQPGQGFRATMVLPNAQAAILPGI